MQKSFSYAKNLQGDVIAIINSEGEILARYEYDAWGNNKVLNPDGTENTTSSFIGNLNPFRYRSYYYDVETKLYFLKTRYYDPELGRFITIDDINILGLTMKNLNGLNLYSYCYNNPVMMVDSVGMVPIVSAFHRTYYKETYGFNNKWWGKLNYSATYISEQTDEAGLLYAFTDLDIKTRVTTWGIGINAWDWFGISLNFDTDINISFGVNITPWFNIGASLGLDGISINLGMNTNGTSHDVNIGIGIAPLIVIVGVFALITTGGQALPVVSTWFKTIFA